MSSFTDAELHALADERLDAARRGELRKRLAASATDRARVESWREQNELIRAAFADVTSEPIPVSLNLARASHLRCVSRDVTPAASAGSQAPRRHRHLPFAALSLILLLGGVGAAFAWWSTLSPSLDGQSGGARATDDVSDTVLAAQTRAVLASPLLPVPVESEVATELPLRIIPDLRDAGYVFVGAVAQAASVVFLYRHGRDRLALGAANATRSEPSESDVTVPGSHAVTWHHRGRRFALVGSPAPSRLTEIAHHLQSDVGSSL